jgi:UV DNA damage repair endonuclease
MTRIIETWDRRDIKPKFHVSEQKPGANVGAHSDFVTNVPEYLIEAGQRHPKGATIMIEAKAKEQAILRLQRQWDEEARLAGVLDA